MTRRCAVPGCSRLARPGGWTRCWEHLLEQLYAPRPPVPAARPLELTD